MLKTVKGLSDWHPIPIGTARAGVLNIAIFYGGGLAWQSIKSSLVIYVFHSMKQNAPTASGLSCLIGGKMVDADIVDLNNAAHLDDVASVAVFLRAATGLPDTGLPDDLLPQQDEWSCLTERQRRIAIQIWYFANVARRTA